MPASRGFAQYRASAPLCAAIIAECILSWMLQWTHCEHMLPAGVCSRRCGVLLAVKNGHEHKGRIRVHHAEAAKWQSSYPSRCAQANLCSRGNWFSGMSRKPSSPAAPGGQHSTVPVLQRVAVVEGTAGAQRCRRLVRSEVSVRRPVSSSSPPSLQKCDMQEVNLI